MIVSQTKPFEKCFAFQLFQPKLLRQTNTGKVSEIFWKQHNVENLRMWAASAGSGNITANRMENWGINYLCGIQSRLIWSNPLWTHCSSICLFPVLTSPVQSSAPEPSASPEWSSWVRVTAETVVTNGNQQEPVKSLRGSLQTGPMPVPVDTKKHNKHKRLTTHTRTHTHTER